MIKTLQEDILQLKQAHQCEIKAFKLDYDMKLEEYQLNKDDEYNKLKDQYVDHDAPGILRNNLSNANIENKDLLNEKNVLSQLNIDLNHK